jgi:hypothetical protein
VSSQDKSKGRKGKTPQEFSDLRLGLEQQKCWWTRPMTVPWPHTHHSPSLRTWSYCKWWLCSYAHQASPEDGIAYVHNKMLLWVITYPLILQSYWIHSSYVYLQVSWLRDIKSIIWIMWDGCFVIKNRFLVLQSRNSIPRYSLNQKHVNLFINKRHDTGLIREAYS